MSDTPIRWRVTRGLMRPVIRGAVRRGLRHRALLDADGAEIRWTRREITAFLDRLDAEIARLRETADLAALPSFGNRLMVELAVYTAAMDRQLRADGVAPQRAREVVADIGWDLYAKSLRLASFPARLVTHDPGKRMRWTIRTLLRFPFNTPGAPGYAAEVRVDGEDILTHFTHCPPQSFVRKLSEETGDPDALEAFRQSWCRYDWAGADLIADDGARGHYARPRTLSYGDPVCDMCWAARGGGDPRTGPDARAEHGTD